MIRNLNPLTFRDFGSVLPERSPAGKPGEQLPAFAWSFARTMRS